MRHNLRIHLNVRNSPYTSRDMSSLPGYRIFFVINTSILSCLNSGRGCLRWRTILYCNLFWSMALPNIETGKWVGRSNNKATSRISTIIGGLLISYAVAKVKGGIISQICTGPLRNYIFKFWLLIRKSVIKFQNKTYQNRIYIFLSVR